MWRSKKISVKLTGILLLEYLISNPCLRTNFKGLIIYLSCKKKSTRYGSNERFLVLLCRIWYYIQQMMRLSWKNTCETISHDIKVFSSQINSSQMSLNNLKRLNYLILYQGLNYLILYQAKIILIKFHFSHPLLSVKYKNSRWFVIQNAF